MNMDSKRLVSLDAFRGFTIAAMILVNFPGNWDYVFKPLRHTEWWGISFTDLIAPFFLFTVGVSIALAYTKQLDAGRKPQEMYSKLFIRSIKIFAVGMFLNVLGILDNFSWAELRWTGTLHRISIVFLVCALLYLHTNWRTQAMIASVLLVLYCVVMVFIPTPGYDKAMLEPGVNLAAWVDQQLLPGKMWQGTWDPEGILSTFPSFVTGITGMLAGKLLVSKKTIDDKVVMLFFWGFISCVIGMIWSWSFGLNENLWSPSFVLFTSGLAAITVASFIYVIDMNGQQKWAQFGVIYGMNAIAVYVLADLLAIIFYRLPLGSESLNMHAFNVLTSLGVAPKVASMIYGLFYVGVNFIPALILYRKKIFIKL
jgi:predicted acyltransferase